MKGVHVQNVVSLRQMEGHHRWQIEIFLISDQVIFEKFYVLSNMRWDFVSILSDSY